MIGLGRRGIGRIENMKSRWGMGARGGRVLKDDRRRGGRVKEVWTLVL